MKQVLHTLLIEDSEDDAFLILLNLRKGPFDIQSKCVENEKDLIYLSIYQPFKSIFKFHRGNIPDRRVMRTNCND